MEKVGEMYLLHIFEQKIKDYLTNFKGKPYTTKVKQEIIYGIRKIINDFIQINPIREKELRDLLEKTITVDIGSCSTTFDDKMLF